MQWILRIIMTYNNGHDTKKLDENRIDQGII